MDNSEQLVDLVVSAADRSPLNFKTKFQEVFAQKIMDRLADVRVQVAQNFFGNKE